jgi:hypothetical protein
MNFKCTACNKYSYLDQDKTSTLDEGTILMCQLCGEASIVAVRAVPSRSEARRVLTQMGVDLSTVDLSIMTKEE